MIKSKLRTLLFPHATSLDRVHLRDILSQETVGGLLMLSATVAALVWANLAPSTYENITHLHLGPLSLGHWVSDGLLTIFFFVAGMELKREFVEGSLSKPSHALIPIIAAATGMALPALIFAGVNVLIPGGNLHGWAIPVATDIAFALAVLAIVGSNLPDNLRSFLLTLAIVDDLGAILIIAIFFAGDINLLWLLGALVICGVWWLLQRRRVRGWYLYVPLALAAWWCTLQSGLHPTIVGVALGMLVFGTAEEENDTLDRWQHAIHPLSAGFVVPVFALFSAGVVVDPASLLQIFTHPVGLGIVLGLVVGKTIGVFSGALATAVATKARLGGTLRWREVLGAAQLAGIGFTVSLLLVDLSFPGDPHLVELGKSAVLMASLISAIIGGAALRHRSRKRRAIAAQTA